MQRGAYDPCSKVIAQGNSGLWLREALEEVPTPSGARGRAPVPFIAGRNAGTRAGLRRQSFSSFWRLQRLRAIRARRSSGSSRTRTE